MNSKEFSNIKVGDIIYVLQEPTENCLNDVLYNKYVSRHGNKLKAIVTRIDGFGIYFAGVDCKFSCFHRFNGTRRSGLDILYPASKTNIIINKLLEIIGGSV